MNRQILVVATRYKQRRGGGGGEELHTNCFIDFSVDTNSAIKVLFENPYEYSQLVLNRTSEIESYAFDHMFFKTFTENFFSKQTEEV